MKLALHWQVLIGMAAGLCFALAFGEVGWIGWIADLFMRLLRMVIVPLIFTSIVHGVSGIGDGRSIGRLGGKTLLWYALSSFMAILVGLTLANSIRPGRGLVMPEGVEPLTPDDLQTPSSMADILQRLVPDNPVGAAAGGDILGLIFFSIVLGAAIGVMTGKTGELLREGFSAGFEAMMKVTTWVIRLLPIGVFALLARAVSQMGLDVFQQVGKYVLTIAVGLTLHVFIVLPLLFSLLARKNPIHHYRAMASAMAMAFSTSSSAATLPMTMKCLREKVGASNRVTSFVAPMGATVNMDGTALLEIVGALFIAQALGVELSLYTQLVVVLTALLASVGAAAIPSAGLVMIFIVLEAIDLTTPEAYALAGLMLSVDRPLDMFRTMVNITSDSVGAAVIAKSEGEELNY
ncbi:MAG: dicarboxylate/amino acid:cation symporter [Holophagales bacterium]|nr:dicarboxylate/amino acid:cation symporter [Holophagales bacterium]MXX60986.1 dicarboxylate/amino acid:cation symporter [Holophagales bacterium]MYC11785.1 dicarboxylate/amino acid:cation symporter [Holophagales bacterium]MYD22316.1 dicarboxylate/amino acid:cation symporter [Holophagales bacterium]MYI34144.1 dicarboxylate/amino acid:cation symporter [Holophagales bacterium]